MYKGILGKEAELELMTLAEQLGVLDSSMEEWIKSVVPQLGEVVKGYSRRSQSWQTIPTWVEQTLDEFNEYFEGFGTEVYPTNDEVSPENQIFYVNMGDVYDLTLVYQNEMLMLTTLGDAMKSETFEYKNRMNEDLSPGDEGYEEEQREYVISALWDLGKDLYGIKPRWVNFQGMTLAELNELYDEWVEELKVKMAMEKEEEKKTDAEFERAVNELVKTGSSREDAISHLAPVYLSGFEIYDERDANLFLQFDIGLSQEKAKEVAPIMFAALDLQKGLGEPGLEKELDLIDEYDDLY